MKPPSSGDTLEWRECADSDYWDRALVALGGHPLQSALWGDARREADGIGDRRWMALSNGKPVWLARIEQRRSPVGWIGWVPRGPTGDRTGIPGLPEELKDLLDRQGMTLLVTDRWCPSKAKQRRCHAPRTIWIDMTCGLDMLSKKLDKQWRYGVGRSRRDGVIVDTATTTSDIRRFSALCGTVAETKHFKLNASPSLMENLLARSEGPVTARLFLARFHEATVAGAFIVRCGRSLHYFWGGTDRTRARVRAAEAVQWAAIEWGVAEGCTRYDLEGIDPQRNPGTYAFKKKMGGQEVRLTGKQYYPLKLRGHVLAWADRRFRQ